MRYPVRLFLGNMEVEFSTPPEILFNYTETDLTNPTIVKNSYSKTVTIEGTQNNNKIFGHIYNLERIQDTNGSIMGTSFNPLVKTYFTLFYNGSIYESGYFKLDEIRRNDNSIEYDITLYGGLGDFFYNLSYRGDGNKLELSDLRYNWENNTGQELGFTINKETVAEAWENIWQPSSKWDTINFAPCYNGKPSSLAADKFLINKSGLTQVFGNSYSGYSVGTSEHEHTEWETFDLRSYLQRPVVRVKEIIEAICDPQNNGWYTVNLDGDFFHVWNPYYYDAWMTLPLLTELDVPATVETPFTVSAITHDTGCLYNVYDGLASVSNVSVDVTLCASANTTGDTLYLTRDYISWGGITLQSDFVSKMYYQGVYMVQLLGYDEDGKISAVSDVYKLASDNTAYGNGYDKSIDWCLNAFNAQLPQTEATTVKELWGSFKRVGSTNIFAFSPIHFSFPSDASFTSLKLKVVGWHRKYVEKTFLGSSWSEVTSGATNLFTSMFTQDATWRGETDVWNMYRTNSAQVLRCDGATGSTTSYDGFYSGRKYTKKDLLTLGVSPADFLLSYSKLFGLYFIKDVESKTIDILTRHNFYKRDEIININDLIDKGSDIKITPCTPKYQYYDLGLEEIDSEAAASYKKTYGNDYGTQVINTGYQFEKEHKKLLDGNIFKGGVTALERNKYFQKPTEGVPCLVYNGFSYTYINSTGGTVEEKITPRAMTGEIINPDGLQYYDYAEKVQFHGADNDAVDGSFVLLFCTRVKYDVDQKGYKITDDINKMYTLNDGQPCWLITKGTTDVYGNTIAIVPNTYPIFTRDVYRGNFVDYSFEIGTPRTLYVPEKYASEWQNIYFKAWKTYLTDMYNENTRVLKCKCLLRERPNPEWMRRFYWFDNCYWRLNSIKDWNISSNGTTEMEFIKVQNIDAYDNLEISSYPTVEITLDKYVVPNTGDIITGNIFISNGSGFIAEYIDYKYPNGDMGDWEIQDVMTPYRSTGGVFNTTFRLTIPSNPREETRTINLVIADSYDRWHTVTFTQDGTPQ